MNCFGRCLWSLLWSFLALGAGIGAAPSAAEDADFRPLFNGKDLEGWDGNPKFWSVKDGAITGQTTADNPTDGNTFLVWRRGEVDDFVLRFSYKIVGGNSGVQYRSKEFDQWRIGGYQGDFEAGETFSGILYEERGRGILCNRGQKTALDREGKKTETQVTDSAQLQAAIKKEDWNEYEISASGGHLIHKINGRVTAECDDQQTGARAESGLLALQLHAGPPMTVQFKDIRLKRLPLADGRKKLVLIAGGRSHAYGQHAFHAGSRLLKQRLDAAALNLLTTVYTNNWPQDPSAFDNCDAVCIYCDGGDGHPFNQRLDLIDALAAKGVGIGCMHYGVETPKGKTGDAFLRWIGGYFEAFWSVNPTWALEKTQLAPGHPITRGVKAFVTNDEWYYHMRFRPNMQGVTAILSATPPASTLDRPDGPHSGNPDVRKVIGQPQVLLWATERADGGRGFGYTGGHYHINWAHDDNRKLILNALAWIAKVDIPPSGIASSTPTLDELEKNQDFDFPGEAVRAEWSKRLGEFQQTGK